MARFVRDEKRTYPFTWLIIGGVFALSTFWAVYAELVTRVPWQAHQQEFFELELRLAQEDFERQKARWEKISQEEPLKGQLARAKELEAEMQSGEYADARAQLDQLDLDFANAEVGKTFGASDLDEAYYYRNLAEYKRDAAMVEVRKLYVEHYGGTEPERAKNEPHSIYLDPSAPAREEGESVEAHHLRTEVARMTAHRDRLAEALSTNHPQELLDALQRSYDAEQAVIDALAIEQKHQKRIDDALDKMKAIDGPIDPRISAKDPEKLDELRMAARAKACKGKENTRNCIKWLRLGPKDKELKSLKIAIAKAKRPLEDAELRLSKAKAKAEPDFDISDPIGSLVGPFQIQQIVTSWMDYERDVDIQQVDRCHTCHMGVNSNAYDAPEVDFVFRTHPRRDALMASHPIPKFGCTACHQGQGRATDDLAHSMWQLEVHHGHERWHYVGDHYWEDPMLPSGKMTKIVIDGRNDMMMVKVGRGKATAITLEHRNPTQTVDQDESPEQRLFQEIHDKLKAVVDADKDTAGKYRPVVRRVDNRITIGIERLPGVEEPKKGPPKFEIEFVKAGLGRMLGFGTRRELAERDVTLYTAKEPPYPPIRAENDAAQGQTWAYETKKNGKVEAKYAYVPPNGAHGLQVPDDMRNRMIRGLPQIEAGCLRCHSADVDLVPWRSDAKHVDSKLAYMKAEAQQEADPAGYREKHGTDALPAVHASTRDALESPGSLAPTLDEGRRLFRQLNCTGCHLLEGFENNPDQGPQLNDISAKVKPEWLLKWLRHPRGWRAKTSMPNLWPAPLDPATKIPRAEGSPEYEKWRKEMTEETIAVAAFLWERSENPESRPDSTATKPFREKIAGTADVEGADAELGKEIFEAYGCQGCHAVTEGEDLPAEWKARERDIAPTLSNLKDKIASEDWLAFWVKNPSAYWHKTSMPNLRLSDVEAASVAKYLISLSAKPPFPAKVTDEEVKMFTNPKKRQEEMVCALAGGVKMSRVECGAKVIEKRGCYGCHNIEGFDKFAPIGPELSGFAKKDISTLDYGYAIADHHLQTTETFAALKLDSPRIFSRDRIQLFMGDFDMSAREIRALTLFLKGVVPAKPNNDFDPYEQEKHASVVRGRQLVSDLNCRGCHVIEGRGAEIDGWANRKALINQDIQRRAPFLDAEGARVQPEWLFTFLRDPQENGIRPWLHPEWVWGQDVPKKKRALRMPTFNLTAEQWTDIVRYFATWDERPYPYEVPQVRELDKQEKLWAVSNVNNTGTGNCLSCHYYGEFPVDRGKEDIYKMAPNMAIMKKRLRPEWVKNWLLSPASFLPYTKMTAFWATKSRAKDAEMFPGDLDPFMSPKPPGWEKVVANFREVNNEEQVELMRDFLFSIPEGVPWPKKGEEATSPMVDPEAAKKLAAEAGEGEGEDEEPAGGEAPPEPPGDDKPPEQPGG